jgi:hypothetical protein
MRALQGRIGAKGRAPENALAEEAEDKSLMAVMEVSVEAAIALSLSLCCCCSSLPCFSAALFFLAAA